MEEAVLFSVILILTLMVTRFGAHKFTDRENCGTEKEKSKTITGVIRKKYKRDIHHFHFGIFIVILSLILLFRYKITYSLIAMFAIGTSFILDQIMLIVFKKKNYFEKEQIYYSICLHIIAICLSFFIFGD